MDATTQKYHLLLMALETATIKSLTSLFNQHAHPAVAQKKIHQFQVQAASLGSQLARAQLEDKLPDDQLPPAHGYAAIQPVTIEAGITLAMLGVVARTSLVNAYRTSAIAVYDANDIGEWIWTAHPGACPACMAMDGTEHPISEEFESHPNCSCGPEPKY